MLPLSKHNPTIFISACSHGQTTTYWISWSDISSYLSYVGRPLLAEIFAGVNKLTKRDKNKKIYAAYVNYGYTLKEIADLPGVHYATVSRVVRKVEQEM